MDDDGRMVDKWIFQEWPTSFCMAIVVMSILWTSIVDLVLSTSVHASLPKLKFTQMAPWPNG